MTETRQLPPGEGVLISGGGPAGMALALALAQRDVAVRIMDRRRRGAARDDKRILALSHGSRLILEELGVWAAIPATPIDSIHVSQQGGFGRTRIEAAEEKTPALGYVLAAGDLAAALDDAITAAGVAFDAETTAPQAAECDAALLVHAEGGVDDAADARRRNYDQNAVICCVDIAAPHHNIARERFTAAGPAALLPWREQYAVVLTCAVADSEHVAALADDEFLALLQQRFRGQARFTAATPRHVFPLGLRLRRSIVSAREVWVGNAAQTLHPVAGQGFNLALRDIIDLADILIDADDPGEARLLSRYASRRRIDRNAAAAFTHTLVRLFSNDLAPLRRLRGAGLLALDLLPPARSFLARRMMFGARGF